MENKLYSLRGGFKKARKRKGVKQTDVADKFDVSLKTVMNWEQGISVPEFKTMLELCDYFDCDLDYLTGRIQEPTHDIKTVCEITGLSIEAAEKIIEINRDYGGDEIEALSHLVIQEGFPLLLHYYWLYVHLLYVMNYAEPEETDTGTEYSTISETINLSVEDTAEYMKQRVTEAMTFICRDEPINQDMEYNPETGWAYPRKEIDEKEQDTDTEQ